MIIFSRLQSFYQYAISDPFGFIIYIVYFSIALIITLVIHEFAHAYIAYKCGDNTAQMLGRLTLNPLKHLDPIGTVCMVLFGFGWAKPVPINSRNFKNGHVDDFYVSIAGIICNLTLFLISLSFMIAINKHVWKNDLLTHFSYFDLLYSNSSFSLYVLSGQFINDNLLINNMFMAHLMRFFMMLSQFNLIIAIFNAIPIPPLDGFHILNDFVFKSKISMNPKLMRGIQAIFFILVLSGAFHGILNYLSNSIEIGVLKSTLKLVGK